MVARISTVDPGNAGLPVVTHPIPGVDFLRGRAACTTASHVTPLAAKRHAGHADWSVPGHQDVAGVVLAFRDELRREPAGRQDGMKRWLHDALDRVLEGTWSLCRVVPGRPGHQNVVAARVRAMWKPPPALRGS